MLGLGLIQFQGEQHQLQEIPLIFSVQKFSL